MVRTMFLSETSYGGLLSDPICRLCHVKESPVRQRAAKIILDNARKINNITGCMCVAHECDWNVVKNRLPMRNKLFFVLFILFLGSQLSAQSLQDIERIRKEYEEAMKKPTGS